MTDNNMQGSAPQPTPTANAVYEPEKLYDVKLSRPVELLGSVLSPMHINHVAGRFIADLGDAVIDATAV